MLDHLLSWHPSFGTRGRKLGQSGGSLTTFAHTVFMYTGSSMDNRRWQDFKSWEIEAVLEKINSNLDHLKGGL